MGGNDWNGVKQEEDTDEVALRGKRPQPCENCKRGRRKCVMPEDTKQGEGVKCQRCERHGLECVIPNPILTRMDDDDIRQLIHDEFEKLHTAMSSLEDDIASLSSASPPAHLSPPPSHLSYRPSPTTHLSSSQPSPDMENDQQEEKRQQLVLAKKLKSGFNNEPPRSMVIQTPDGRLLQWNISPTREGLSILTNLQSLEELSRFTCYGWQAYMDPQVLQSHFSYLPPPPKAPSRPTRKVLRLNEGKNIFTEQDFQEYMRTLDKLKHRTIIDHTHVEKLEPRRWIPSLLKLYFSVTTAPHIHEPTFWKRYRRMADPMQSGLVTALCALSVLYRWYSPSTFGDRKFSPKEARQLYEYYASCARGSAAEAFDEVSLDTLKVHSLLVRECRAMQRLNDAVMHTKHALRISYALQSQYMDVIESNCGGSTSSVEIEAQEWLRTIWSLYAFCIQQTAHNMDQIFSRNELAARIQELPCIDHLPEESERTRGHIKIYINIIRLLKRWLIPDDPFTQELLAYIIDVPEYASIDLCLKIERDLLDWYHDIPSDIKFLHSPFEFFTVDDLLQKAVTIGEAEPLLEFWVLWMSIHFRFLPSRIEGLESPISAQDRFLHNALETCIIASKNAFTCTMYILEQLKDDASIYSLRLVCDLNWVVANIEGMDSERVRSAKRNLLTTVYIIYKYFRRLNVNSSPFNLEVPQFDAENAEVFLKLFASNPQLVNYIQQDRGFSWAEREQKRFFALLQDQNIQNLLQKFAQDLRL
ncbi:hypothetical protein BZG36_03452 [Bifiguratus adelaidae]|uniref:Zn(2)-C6 fungal-type domain-containing protein n=1 Tax=Bifiguratus adelaidae TaxID=1938954 RepID=A0A261XYC9_9FUNG|nr:hypothetical protein BZG36_03452 [Bifiguratus adelaidae]